MYINFVQQAEKQSERIAFLPVLRYNIFIDKSEFGEAMDYVY